MPDLDQARRTVRVLELLSDAFQAHQRGDDSAFSAAADAAMECDAAAVSVVRGGMIIGEIPRPEENWPAWVAYVDSARDALAAPEAAATRDCSRCDGCGQLADSDDREPWTFWMSLPVKSAAAVLLGLVKPVPCDVCGGTGKVAGA